VYSSDFYWLRTYSKEWYSTGKGSYLEGNISIKYLDSLDKRYAGTSQYNFFGNPKKIDGHVSCSLDLYPINGNQLVNLYQGKNFGYNCGAYSFQRESENYMLGGYGFWSSHLDLIKFDSLQNSWELVGVENQPFNFSSSGTYQNSKGIVVLLVSPFNPRIRNQKQTIEPGFFLDWETKTWKKLEVSIEGVDFLNLLPSLSIYFLETKDYLFIGTSFVTKNLGWNLVHKESGKIYFFLHNRNIDVFLSNHIEIIDNTITYLTSTNELITLDLDDFFSKSIEVGEVSVVEDGGLPFSASYLFIFPLLIASFGLFVIYFVKRRKKVVEFIQPVEEEEEPLEDKDLLQVVLSYSGQKIGTEKLDQIFGIQGLKNFDTKRIKRARHIKEINAIYMESHGKELIVRDRNPDDKRYMFYKIVP
jgi:hypothetical protein